MAIFVRVFLTVVLASFGAMAQPYSSAPSGVGPREPVRVPSSLLPRKPLPPVTSSRLQAFLFRHRGPILDVRNDGDCDARRIIPGTTLRLAFDADHADPDAVEMAKDAFVDRLRTHPAFDLARRDQTTVFVVCCQGVSSAVAAAAMAKRGFKVVTLQNGIMAANLTDLKAPPRFPR